MPLKLSTKDIWISMLWFSIKWQLFCKQKDTEPEEQDVNLIHVIQTFLIWEMTTSILTWKTFDRSLKKRLESIMKKDPSPPSVPPVNHSLWEACCHGTGMLGQPWERPNQWGKKCGLLLTATWTNHQRRGFSKPSQTLRWLRPDRQRDCHHVRGPMWAQATRQSHFWILYSETGWDNKRWLLFVSG